MAQEENQRFSNNNSSGGGGVVRVSKKPKQKKIPQRGLGVAQLEKIRIEEEQKNEATGSGIVGVGSSSSSSSSSFIVLPLPKHHNISSSSLPLKELPSFRSNFRPKFEVFGQSPTLPSCPQPLPTPLYGHNTSFGVGSTIGGGNSYFPSVLNSCEMSYDREGSNLHPGLMFHTHMHHNEMNTIAPSSTVNGMQKQHYYPEQGHSSKVNVSNTNSSRLNVQIEPPSNQSYNSNCRFNPLLENEKMIGTKRQWPFSLDNPSSPSNCNYPPLIPRIPRSDERPLAPTYENGGSGSGTLRFEQGFSSFREGPSIFSAQQFDWKAGMPELNLKNGSKENGALDTVLTLGISTASSSSTTKAKQPLECPASDFNMSTHQEYYGDTLFQRSDQPVQSQCLYNFFPQKTPQIGLLAANSGDRRVGTNDCVDLDLKL